MKTIKYDLDIIDECMAKLEALESVSDVQIQAFTNTNSNLQHSNDANISVVQAQLINEYIQDIMIIKANITDMRDNLKYAKIRVLNNDNG